MSTGKQVRKPIIRPINNIDVWEHTPLDYYRYGEYPRFLRPPGPRMGDFELLSHQKSVGD